MATYDVLDIGLRRVEHWRSRSWFVSFRCGCHGDMTETCAPYITVRCSQHLRTNFTEAA